MLLKRVGKPLIALSALLVPWSGFASDAPKFSSYLQDPEQCTLLGCPAGAFYIKDSAGLNAVADGLIAQGQDIEKTGEWTNNHYALLLEPGTTPYLVNGHIKMGESARTMLGYYTQILGLGKSPSNVVLQPGIEVYNQCPDGPKSCSVVGGLNNFWRGIENLKMEIDKNNWNTDHQLTFAVSQASPIRSIDATGGTFVLCDWRTDGYSCGYTSGGFLANSHVQKLVPGSQQQWMVRNSNLDDSETATWNYVLVGTSAKLTAPQNPTPHQAPQDNPWLSFPIADQTLQTPLISEKPYLSHAGNDKNSGWSVIVPELKRNSTGADFYQKQQRIGLTLDLDSEFLTVGPALGQQDPQTKVIKLDETVIDQINTALNEGKNLIFMPGAYALDKTIIVPKKDGSGARVILGIGLPSLICEGASTCMDISANQGVKLAGVVFEAGVHPEANSTLLKVGEKNTDDNSANPIIMYDVYARVAETQRSYHTSDAKEPSTDNAFIINANNVIGDNLWIWRGDHDKGSLSKKITWNDNPAKHGLIVYGDNVLMYGLAVEHFRDYQTMWYGNGGKIYFYQSEMPYEVTSMNQWACSYPNGSSTPSTGCVSLWISPDVTDFYGVGLGVYTYFRDAVIKPLSGITAPKKSNIILKDIVGRWLNGTLTSGLQSLVRDYDENSYGLEATCNDLDSHNSCSSSETMTSVIGKLFGARH